MKKTSHASTPGPPDGSMPAVNSYRDESGLPSSRMKRDEGRFRRPDCVHLKSGSNTLKIGTWNVRTLNQLGKLENLRQEADALDAHILGISEVRYIGEGKEPLGNYTVRSEILCRIQTRNTDKRLEMFFNFFFK